MSSVPASKREALRALQRRMLEHVALGRPGDTWGEQHLETRHPELIEKYLRQVHPAAVLDRLRIFFPGFVRHAGLMPAQVREHFRVHRITGPHEALIELYLERCLSLVEDRPVPQAWREQLLIERASYLAAYRPIESRAQLIEALAKYERLPLDARGTFDLPGAHAVHLRTNWFELYRVPERAPSEACEFGPPRTAFFFYCPQSREVRGLAFQNLKELRVRICFGE